MSKVAVGVGIFVVLAVIGSLSDGDSSSGGSGGGGSYNRDVDSYGAEDTCKDAVKNSLKSPGTAKFHNLTTTGYGPWTTMGDVDSENGFGALIRSTFTCETTLEGDTYHSRVTDFVDGGDR